MEDDRIQIPQHIQYIAQIVSQIDGNIYLVGGYVRDTIMGIEHAYDYDISGDILPDDFRRLFIDNDYIDILDANLRLGTVKILVNDQYDVEYTCFRSESYRGDGSHTPTDVCMTDDILLDAKRRDFTINAIYANCLTGIIYDPFDGMKDIDNKIIRTVRNSKQVFTEDALRILRMCRFSGKLGFSIDEDTLDGAIDCAHLITNISKERIGVELDRMLMESEYLELGIKALFESNVHKYISNNLKLENALLTIKLGNNRIVKWAIFLNSLSIDTAENLIKSLALGIELSKGISIILNSVKVLNCSREDIIIHLAILGQDVSKMVLEYISIADSEKYNRLNSIYNSMLENRNFVLQSDLVIDGNDIMELLSIPNGKLVGEIKDRIYRHVILNPMDNDVEKLYNFIKKYYKL